MMLRSNARHSAALDPAVLDPEDAPPAFALWVGTVMTVVGFGWALIAVAMG